MHEAPERSRAGVVIVAVVITALVVGGGVYFWQQGQIQNLKDDVAAAQQSAQSAQASINSAKASSAKLQTQVTDMQKQLRKAQKAAKASRQQLHQQKQATKQAQQANALADGKYFAFIKTAATSPNKITYDVAEYFTGNKADKAAIQDGVIKKGEHVENDVYIRNDSKQLRTADVTSSATVKILTKGGGSPKLKTVSYSEFAKLFNGGGKDNKHLHANGYWLVASNNKITSITEQFHP